MDYAFFCILLCSSAFFSGSETAFFNLSALQLSAFKESKHRGERLVASLRERPKELLVTVLLGNELTNIALSIVSASIFSRLASDRTLIEQALLSSMFVVPILLLCGEITPKTLASYSSKRFATIVIYPLKFFSWATTPIRTLLLLITDTLVGMWQSEENKNTTTTLDEEGFMALVNAGARQGVLEDEERTLIHNAFSFGDLIVKDIMRPWSSVFHLDADTSLDEALIQISAHTYSRVPILKNGQVLGILYTKDLLAYRWGLKEKEEVELIELAHQPLFISIDISLNRLKKIYTNQRKHLAIVSNTAGNPMGMCTMEDLLEVLFGPIHEEEEELQR